VVVTQVLLLLLLLFPVCFVDGGVNVRLLSLREIERAVTTFLNFSALTMKDDDENDDDEKRGEGRESDENIVVVVVVFVVVEQAKNMSFFWFLTYSSRINSYECVFVVSRRVCAFSRNTRVQTYRYENKNAKTMRRYEAMRVLLLLLLLRRRRRFKVMHAYAVIIIR